MVEIIRPVRWIWEKKRKRIMGEREKVHGNRTPTRTAI
jgi:hypothetical protein